MAKISSYPHTVPTTGDSIVISKSSDKTTRSTTVGDIINLINTGLLPGVGTVTSIGITAPSAFTVANSPITDAGTITITGAGTASQYIDGTGALQSSPNQALDTTSNVTFSTIAGDGAAITNIDKYTTAQVDSKEISLQAQITSNDSNISALQGNQNTGVASYVNLADLPVTGVALTSYKVTNDSVSSTNNGYYTWNGVSYDKDAPLNETTFDKTNDSDASTMKATADFIYKENLKEDWQNPSAYSNQDWLLSSGGSVIDNLITIESDENQAKIKIPNTVVNGEKYILLLNIEDFQSYHQNVTGINIFSKNNLLISEFLPDNNKKIYAVSFTPTDVGDLVLYVKGDVNSGTPVSGVDLVSFTSDFFGCIPWTQQKEDYWYDIADNYTTYNFENKSVVNSIHSKSSTTAETSNSSNTSTESDFTNQIKSFFTPTNSSQLLPNDWSLTSGGSKNGAGIITINSNNQQAKLTVPNTTVIGEKYIALGYVNEPEIIFGGVDNLILFNHNQSIFSLSPTASNFNYGVFISEYDNDIKFTVSGTGVNESADGTPLISFQSNCLAVIPWSQEMEDLLEDVKNQYTGGVLNFGKSIYNFTSSEDILDYDSNSFLKIEAKSNKVSGVFDEFIPEWNQTTSATDIVNSIDGDVLTIGGSLDMGTYPTGRLRFGLDIKPENYALEDKTYVVVLAGDIVSTNVDDFIFTRSDGYSFDIAIDLEDSQLSTFKVMNTLSYLEGTSLNTRYVYATPVRRNDLVDDISFTTNFTTYAVFEEIEGYFIDDYITAAKNGLLVPIYTPIGTATETYVDNSISSAIGNVAKLSPNDFSPIFDIEMLASGGQSLNMISGGSNSSNDFKNSLGFGGGWSLNNIPFTTTVEKDAFFGTELLEMNDNSTDKQYPAVTASLATLLNLIENENSVDLERFGSNLMPMTWGLSGAQLDDMNKGTVPYSDFLECVAKAKEFSNKVGKTFGVRACNWYQGEAATDRNGTFQDYYDKESQLFADLNTDIKAITGQTEDVQFFTYQTSPRMNADFEGEVMTDMPVPEAQVQVAKDFANVHIAGAMYQFAYADISHPVDRAVVGLQTGVAIKRVLYDNEVWKDFTPISHTIITDGVNYYTHLKFEAPSKPIRFDISGDAWHNPNGKQVNFGFEVVLSGVEKQTAEPFIVKGDTVVLTTSENPLGMTIRYAVNGQKGGGNLCDSQNIIVRNKGIDYVIDNFSVAFSEYLID